MESTIDQSPPRITIKLTCTKTVAQQFISKFINLFNHISSVFYNSTVYCEEIDTGFLFFCERDEDFALLFTPFPLHTLKMLNKSPLATNKLLDPRLKRDSFPPEGYVFDFEFLNRDATVFLSLIQEFYNSVHPDIQSILISPHITIRFLSWEAFKRYADCLAFTFGL